MVSPDFSGPGSSVGIATGYGLHGLGIEFRWERDFPHLSRPALGAHPASSTMGTGSFPEVKSGRGVTLTPHPLLVPWSRKGTAIPLVPLWAVLPVQSLSACTRVHFTFHLTLSMMTCNPVLNCTSCAFKYDSDEDSKHLMPHSNRDLRTTRPLFGRCSLKQKCL